MAALEDASEFDAKEMETVVLEKSLIWSFEVISGSKNVILNRYCVKTINFRSFLV